MDAAMRLAVCVGAAVLVQVHDSSSQQMIIEDLQTADSTTHLILRLGYDE